MFMHYNYSVYVYVLSLDSVLELVLGLCLDLVINSGLGLT